MRRIVRCLTVVLVWLPAAFVPVAAAAQERASIVGSVVDF